MRAVVLMVVPLAFLALAACEPGSSGTSGAGGATTGSTTSSSTSGGGAGGEGTSSSSSSGAGGMMASSSSSSGTGGGGGGGAPVGTCAKGCAAAADCCPAAAPMTCPNAYPLKLVCAGGICGVGECDDDAECKMFFSMGHVCAPIAGKKSCVLACTTGGNECSAPSTCMGAADNGAMYCKADPKPFVCTMDTDCKGYGKCIGGSCVCTADGDCTNAAVDKCVIP